MRRRVLVSFLFTFSQEYCNKRMESANRVGEEEDDDEYEEGENRFEFLII